MRPTVSVIGMAAVVSLCLAGADSFSRDAQPTALAVAHFFFVDTSGEAEDQMLRHEKQLRAFETELRQTLSADGHLEVVALPCEADRCSLDDPGMDELASQAKTANAKYLLAGGIHKMSTLVGWARITVFDLENSGRVCSRLLTYRGDDAEAWRHAARFGAKDVIRACFR